MPGQNRSLGGVCMSMPALPPERDYGDEEDPLYCLLRERDYGDEGDPLYCLLRGTMEVKEIHFCRWPSDCEPTYFSVLSFEPCLGGRCLAQGEELPPAWGLLSGESSGCL